MPIYEYHCPKCGTFETTQRITEPALKRCPTCKSKVERMISATSFVLKGSGWYATDYARSGSAKAADGSSEKSDSKPSSETASNGTANGSSNAAASSAGSSDKTGSSDKSSGSSSSEKSAKLKSSD
ncbi:MAG: zinc ribbon domain-containing protein [Candidatus Binataceae bacterium]